MAFSNSKYGEGLDNRRDLAHKYVVGRGADKCRSEIYSKIYFHFNFAKYAGPINRTNLKKFPEKKRKMMVVR